MANYFGFGDCFFDLLLFSGDALTSVLSRGGGDDCLCAGELAAGYHGHAHMAMLSHRCRIAVAQLSRV